MIALNIKQNLFRLYLNFPGIRLFFILLKKIYSPSYKVRKYLRFKGTFTLVVSDKIILRLVSHGNTIENELFWLGSKGWEAFSTQLWEKLSMRSDVVFDVGANTGLYSLIASKANPVATIHAFEPLDAIMNRFISNLRLNDSRVNTHAVALADEDGEGKIFTAETISQTFDQASLNEDKYKSTACRYTIIKKKKLSTFIEEQGIKTIDLMKIDVETFEPQVLRGMGPYLKKFAPTILIEILNEKVANEVEALVRDAGYIYYQIDETKGCQLKSDLMPAKRGSNFLLLNKLKHPGFEV